MARKQFPAAELRSKIEHAEIKSLARAVDKEIETVETFPLDSRTGDLSYRVQNKELKRFLLRTATRRGANSDEKLSQMLGVTEKAISDWKKALAENYSG